MSPSVIYHHVLFITIKITCNKKKGKERWPGEFPVEINECVKEMQYSSAKSHIGDKSGLYHFYNGFDQDAFVGCG